MAQCVLESNKVVSSYCSRRIAHSPGIFKHFHFPVALPHVQSVSFGVEEERVGKLDAVLLRERVLQERPFRRQPVHAVFLIIAHEHVSAGIPDDGERLSELVFTVALRAVAVQQLSAGRDPLDLVAVSVGHYHDVIESDGYGQRALEVGHLRVTMDAGDAEDVHAFHPDVGHEELTQLVGGDTHWPFEHSPADHLFDFTGSRHLEDDLRAAIAHGERRRAERRDGADRPEVRVAHVPLVVALQRVDVNSGGARADVELVADDGEGVAVAYRVARAELTHEGTFHLRRLGLDLRRRHFHSFLLRFFAGGRQTCWNVTHVI